MLLIRYITFAIKLFYSRFCSKKKYQIDRYRYFEKHKTFLSILFDTIFFHSFNIPDAPVCVTDKIVIVGAFRSENLNVVCEVHADPPPRSFKWKFNSSGETYEITKDRYNKNGSKSVLHYTPIMDQDYGSLTCQGTNEVGEQSQPCVFQVILAGLNILPLTYYLSFPIRNTSNISIYFHIGLPSTVKNCSISNQTQHSLELQCIPGYDGGLPQVFLLELIASKSGKLR